MINHNPIETVAAVAVGSSAVLGCLLWLARLLIVVALIIEIRVLVSLYKDKREYEQSCREYDQRPCKTDELVGLPDKSARGNLINITQASEQTSQNGERLAGCRIPISIRQLLQPRKMLLGFLSKLGLAFHGSRTKQPNDPKLSHADGRVAPQAR